jgi:predicted RNase H-like HicB family nuclease
MSSMATKTKDLEHYLSLDYPVEFIQDEDGSWFVEIPLLEGCMSVGDTREEAEWMIQDAKLVWLKTALDRDIPIPEP